MAIKPLLSSASEINVRYRGSKTCSGSKMWGNSTTSDKGKIGARPEKLNNSCCKSKDELIAQLVPLGRSVLCQPLHLTYDTDR